MSDTKTLSADDILGADDMRPEPVDVPEWGGRVFVRPMTAKEHDAFDLAGIEGAKDETDADKSYMANYRARLVAACCCDQAGKLLFVPAQVAALGKKSTAALTRVVKAAQRLCRIGPGATEDAKKNSDDAPSEGSPSGSPSA